MGLKFIDLFAGIGGFRYGLEKVSKKFECVWSNEWDKYAAQIYKKHFGECDTRDITKVPISDIPDHDLLVGGFPCQAFSIAGKRKGFDDTRGTLFFEIVRILNDKRPRYFLLENVKGLLGHSEGKTFQTILGILSDLRYEYGWQVLNSKNFGVPQNRERVFIVGYLRGTSRPKVFPITGSYKEADGKIASTAIDKNYWKGIDNHGQRTMIEITKNVSDAQRIYDTKGIARTLKGLGGGLGAKTGLYALAWSKSVGTHKGKTRNEQRIKIGEFNTLSTGSGGSSASSQNFVGKKITATYRHSMDSFKGYEEMSPSIKSSSGSGNQVLLNSIRRLTPTECERLQAFPDDWTKYGINEKGEQVEISDTQRYKVLGNAVTTNVAKEIGERLLNG